MAFTLNREVTGVRCFIFALALFLAAGNAAAAEAVTVFVDGISPWRAWAALVPPQYYDLFVGASNDREADYLRDSPLARAIGSALGGTQEYVVWSGSPSDTLNLDRAVSETVSKITVADRAGKEIHLVTHSMGTVIGYLALARYKDMVSKTSSNRYKGVANFVTLASPLGSKVYMGTLDDQNRDLRIERAIATHRTRADLMIRGHWFNIHAQNDPIGTQLSLGWINNRYLPFTGGPFAAHSFPFNDGNSVRKIVGFLKGGSLPSTSAATVSTGGDTSLRGEPVRTNRGDSPSTATSVLAGKITTGQLEVPRDQNYFRFTPQRSANYVIYTRGSTNTSGELYDEQFKRLEGDCCRGGGLNFRMAKQLEPGRTYYVLVRGEPGTYTLHVDGPESLYSAKEVGVGKVTTGQLEVPRDQNYFRFTPQHSANYVIYTRGSTDTSGELYDEQFKKLEGDCCRGGGLNFRMAKQLEPGQTHYVLVRGEPGAYTLHVDGPESLYSAKEVGVGKVTTGQLEVPRDQNYFRFTPKHSANYVIYTRGSTDTSGELYDDRFKLLEGDCCRGGGQNFRMAKQLEPGRTYYVLVRGEPGAYTLHVDGPESLYSAKEVNASSIQTKPEPCTEYLSSGMRLGYCTDYIECRTGKRQRGDAGKWKGNIHPQNVRPGDVVIFSNNAWGHVAYVEAVIRNNQGVVTNLEISEWNGAIPFNDKAMGLRYGKRNDRNRTIKLTEATRFWRP